MGSFSISLYFVVTLNAFENYVKSLDVHQKWFCRPQRKLTYDVISENEMLLSNWLFFDTPVFFFNCRAVLLFAKFETGEWCYLVSRKIETCFHSCNIHLGIKLNFRAKWVKSYELCWVFEKKWLLKLNNRLNLATFSVKILWVF